MGESEFRWGKDCQVGHVLREGGTALDTQEKGEQANVGNWDGTKLNKKIYYTGKDRGRRGDKGLKQHEKGGGKI